MKHRWPGPTPERLRRSIEPKRPHETPRVGVAAMTLLSLLTFALLVAGVLALL